MAEGEQRNYSAWEIARRTAQRFTLGTNFGRILVVTAIGLGVRSGYSDWRSANESNPVSIAQTLKAINNAMDEDRARIKALEDNTVSSPGKPDLSRYDRVLSDHTQVLKKHEKTLTELSIGLAQNFISDCYYINVSDQMTDEDKKATLAQCVKEVTQGPQDTNR